MELNIQFLKYRKIYYLFAGILTLISLAALIIFGLRFGLDFTGGSLLEIKFQETRLSTEEIRAELNKFNLGEIIIQPTGDRGVIIRMAATESELRELVIAQLREREELIVMRNDLIGPVIGEELRNSAKLLIILGVLAIIIYIALAFGRVSTPVASWQYAVISLITLFYNMLITLAVFAVLGYFYYVEINIPIIVALLVILGYSINDTIVAFDRIRENLIKRRDLNYEEIVNVSLNQTLFRSISTGVNALFVLIALFFFGGITLKYFALALIIGISIGTYSSIFLACPLLVSWLKLKTSK